MATSKRATKNYNKPKNAYRIAVLDDAGNPTDSTYDIPRVTSVLDSVIAKPRLVDWYYRKSIEGFVELRRKYGAKLPGDVDSLRSLLYSEGLSPYSTKKAAAVKGRALHNLLESLARGDSVDPDVLSSDGKGLLAWWNARELAPENVLALERTLVSFNHRYAGTVDLIYRSPASGRVVLTDLKTGNYVYWTHFLQGEAYREAWLEDGGEAPDRVSIVHLNLEKVGGDGWEELVAPEITFETFKHTLEIYNQLPKNWKPDDIPEENDES